VFGPLPAHAQAAQGQTNGFVADQPRRDPLGEADLGSQGEGPPARRLAERPRAVVQQGTEGLAGPSVEDGRQGVRSG